MTLAVPIKMNCPMQFLDSILTRSDHSWKSPVMTLILLCLNLGLKNSCAMIFKYN